LYAASPRRTSCDCTAGEAKTADANAPKSVAECDKSIVIVGGLVDVSTSK
jgi:hypothetical protein